MPSISFTIDLVPTALVFAAASSISLIILAAYLRKASSHRQLWACGILAIAAGMLLVIARGHIADVLSILVGNLLIIGAYAGFAAGTHRLVGRPVGLPFAIGAAAAVVFSVAYAMGASFETRVVIISVLTVAECALLTSAFLRAPPHWTTRLATAVFAVNAALAIARLLGVLGLIEVPGGIGMLHAIVLNFAVAVTFGVALVLLAINAPVLRPQPAFSEAALPKTSLDAWQLLHARSLLLAPSGSEIRLTGSEYMLLRQLAGQHEPVPRLVLNGAIGRDTSNPKDRSIDIIISRLRKKCADAGLDLPVTAVRGVGYVFQGSLLTAA